MTLLHTWSFDHELAYPHEARGQKDFMMSMRDAKDLHADITKLLITLEQMRSQQARGAEVVEVQITGGSFKSA
jgi:DNA-binding protein YbaB